MTELMVYVKAHHLTGVTFNPRGGDLAAAKPAPAAPKAAAAAGGGGAAAASKSGLGAALAGLQGANDLQSKGLRKVEKSEQTFRKEYAGGAAPAAPKPKPKVQPRKQTVTKGDPKKALVGKKWMVENFTKADGVVTIDMDAKEGHKYAVYVCAYARVFFFFSGRSSTDVFRARRDVAAQAHATRRRSSSTASATP